MVHSAYMITIHSTYMISLNAYFSWPETVDNSMDSEVLPRNCTSKVGGFISMGN